MKIQIANPKASNSRIALSLCAIGIMIALIAMIMLFGAQISSASAQVSPEIEGTWLAMVTVPEGPPFPFPSLVTYASGGALTVTDSSVPPALGNVYQGSWTRTGPHEFAFTFLGFQYDEAGGFSGYITAHEILQLEPGGDVYNGVTSLAILDPDMNVIVEMTSTSHATRISAR
jgi:hypothetical protein